jgi:hypothetical protein
MLMDVTDLNMNFLGNWSFLSGVSYHVFRSAGVCTTATREFKHERIWQEN